MAGNVWEWVGGWYDEDYYKNSPDADPQGPASGEVRVVRGGSWVNLPRVLRGVGSCQGRAGLLGLLRLWVSLCPGSFPLTLFPFSLYWGEAQPKSFGYRQSKPLV